MAASYYFLPEARTLLAIIDPLTVINRRSDRLPREKGECRNAALAQGKVLG